MTQRWHWHAGGMFKQFETDAAEQAVTSDRRDRQRQRTEGWVLSASVTLTLTGR